MENRVLRCTICGLKFEDRNDDTLVECKACGNEFLAIEGSLFNNKNIQEIEQVKKIRQLLEESILYNDIELIRTYSLEILKVIPNDLLARYFNAYATYYISNPKMMIDFLSQEKIEDSPKKIEKIIEHMVTYIELKEIDFVSGFIKKFKPEYIIKADQIFSKRIKLEENYSSIPRDVFISYRSSDIQATMDIVESIEKNGFTCWYSHRNLKPDDNDNYWNNIEEAIDLSSIVVVISSQNAMLSKDVQREINFANKKKKILLEYKIDNSEHTALFKYVFDGKKWIDAINSSNHYELINRIFTHLSISSKSDSNLESLRELLRDEKYEIVNEQANVRLLSNPYDFDSWLFLFLSEIKTKELNLVKFSDIKVLPKSFYKALEYSSGEIKSKLANIEHAVNFNQFEIKNNEILLYKGNSSKIIIPENVDKIGAYAFSDNKIIEIVEFSKDVRIVEERAFKGCINIKKIILNDNVIKIYDNAFESCESLSAIKLPENLIYLGKNVFKDSGISILDLPNNLEVVEPYLTSNSRIKKISIGKKVNKINKDAFIESDHLESIYVDIENKYFCQVDEVLFDSKISELIKYPTNKKTPIYNLPESVESINDNAFESNKNLVIVNFNYNLKRIKNKSFFNSQKIEKISLSNDLIEIHSNAFSKMTNLRSVHLNSQKTLFFGDQQFLNNFRLIKVSITFTLEIPSECFLNNTSLIEIDLPKELIKINSKAFNNCKMLKEVSISKNCEFQTDSFDISTQLNTTLFG